MLILKIFSDLAFFLYSPTPAKEIILMDSWNLLMSVIVNHSIKWDGERWGPPKPFNPAIPVAQARDHWLVIYFTPKFLGVLMFLFLILDLLVDLMYEDLMNSRQRFLVGVVGAFWVLINSPLELTWIWCFKTIII